MYYTHVTFIYLFASIALLLTRRNLLKDCPFPFDVSHLRGVIKK